MISYKPLLHWMLENNIKKSVLVNDIGLSWSTVNKLNNNQQVELQVIERICIYFDLKVNEVLEIKKGPAD